MVFSTASQKVEGKMDRRVKFVKPGDFTKDDWCFPEEEYQKLLAHEGKEAKVTSCVMEGPTPDEGYFDIEFDDGFEVFAVSDYHLEPIKSEDEERLEFLLNIEDNESEEAPQTVRDVISEMTKNQKELLIKYIKGN